MVEAVDFKQVLISLSIRIVKTARFHPYGTT